MGVLFSTVAAWKHVNGYETLFCCSSRTKVTLNYHSCMFGFGGFDYDEQSAAH